MAISRANIGKEIKMAGKKRVGLKKYGSKKMAAMSKKGRKA